MARHPKTERLIVAAAEILREHRPMTVRQVHYQLVSRQATENTPAAYQALIRALVGARKDGSIAWDWIEDRLRRPRHVNMWSGLPAFAKTALQAYRRDVWQTQPGYLECWLEKDALSGIFERTLAPYGVTLNVGRGFDGWTSIKDAAERFMEQHERRKHVTVIYFGDFDPSGEDMVRSLTERLAWFDVRPTITKAAIGPDDIVRLNLPTDFAKATDSRRAKFVARHGDVSVELDALPPDLLADRIRREVERRIDPGALAAVRTTEASERRRLQQAIGGSL